MERPKFSCFHETYRLPPPRRWQRWSTRLCPNCHAVLGAVPIQRGTKIKWIWKEVVASGEG